MHNSSHDCTDQTQGMPYKYVVSVDSKPFSEAPPTIMNIVNRLTWAGKKVVNDGTYQQFNELLCLGYFENQSIGVSSITLTPLFHLFSQPLLTTTATTSTTTTAKKISDRLSPPSPSAAKPS